MKVIKNFKAAANSIPGSIGQIIKEKLVWTLSKNKGFHKLQKVSTILNGWSNYNFKINPAIIPKFKFFHTGDIILLRKFGKTFIYIFF